MSEVHVERLSDGNVKIVGITSEPVVVTPENFLALTRVCYKIVGKYLDEAAIRIYNEAIARAEAEWNDEQSFEVW